MSKSKEASHSINNIFTKKGDTTLSSIEISKTYTNNPFIDYLLYYTKLLSFGSVIKNEEEAMKNETKESILAGDILISCFEGTAVFELFNYDEAILKSAGITGSYHLSKCMEDKTYIPDLHDMIELQPAYDEITNEEIGGIFNGTSYKFGEYFKVETIGGGITFRNYKVKKLNDGRVVGIYALRDELTKKGSKVFIETYNETNNYYRKLAGLPPIGDYGVPIMDYEYIPIASSTIEEFINVDGATYVHELTPTQIQYLEDKGIMDQIRADYPNADYLDYIGDEFVEYDSSNENEDRIYRAKKIYKARKAYNFQLLYTPDVENDYIVTSKFKTKYEENRLFVMNTFYNDIFKETSDYYDNFIGMMIMIMTITDILSEVHQDIIKTDLLDKRCIQYIFEIYGMPYYNTIPLKYQYRMCKNINQLIRYKSCSQGMINLIDLFGAPNIEVFKYFILRDRKIDKWGDIIYNELETKTSKLNDTIFHERVSREFTRTYELAVKDGIAYLNGSDGSLSKVIISDIASNLNSSINTSVVDREPATTTTTIYKLTNDSSDNAYIIKEEKVDKKDGTTSSTSATDNYYKLSINKDNNIEIEYYDINLNLFYNENDRKWYSIENGRLVETNIETRKTKEIINNLSPKEWDYTLSLSKDSTKVVVTFTRKGLNDTTFSIPYPKFNTKPFDNYLKNNIMKVVYNNQILTKDKDYTISSDKTKITITKSGLKQKDIIFDFYYNKESIEPFIDVDNGYIISTEICDVVDTNIIMLNNLPTPTFLTDGNQIMIVVDGDILINTDDITRYTIDYSKNRIVLIDTPKDSTATVIYIYNKDNIIKLSEQIESMSTDTDDEASTADYKRDMYIKFPFDKYLDRGNEILIAKCNSSDNRICFLSSNDYTIEDNEVTFKNNVTIADDTIMKVFFIYSENSIFNNISINETTEEIIATENFQVSFKLNPPFKNFFDLGYKAYPRLRSNKEYLSTELYDIFNNTLTIKDQAIGLQKGQKITITYVSGPDTSNIICSKQRLTVDKQEQTIFKNLNISDEYFFSGNNAIVDITGRYLNPTDYAINDADKTLTISNLTKLPSTSDCINITYIKNNTTNTALRIKRDRIKAIKNTNTYKIEVPFKSYIETKQSVLVFHNFGTDYSSLVTNFSLTNDYITIPDEEFSSNDSIDILFIYNNKYINDLSNLIKEEVIPIKTTDIDNKLQIQIPYPFDNYESNGWLMFITDENDCIIDESKYDILSGYLTFLNSNDLLKYNTLNFHFIYFDNSRYVYKTYTEDYDKDIDLKFVGVPIEDTFFNKNIIKKTNLLPYDETTLEDKYWDGVGFDDDQNKDHLRVKEQILAKEFNYERTKYFGINYVLDIAEMSFKIAYFYNIFFDDVFKEDKVKIAIPSIVPYKKFNVAYLFTYLNALAYLYSGVDDTIIDTTGKILYIKGFNFKADIPKIKKWILDQRRHPENFDTTFIYQPRPEDENTNVPLPDNRTKKIWDFDIKPGETNVFNSLKEIVDMFTTGKKVNGKTTNRDIYNFIVRSIYQSQDYDIFKIWKKIFDTLMTYKQSFDYYHITENGTTRIAKSLSEFLKYKDIELYNDYMKLKYIIDKDQRNEAIVDRISDVVYILEDYLNLKEFQNIFDHLPGVSGDAFLDMLYTILNFFKSYKIVLRSKGDYIVFNAKDPLLNTLRYVDVKDNFIEMNKYDYIAPLDSIRSTMQVFTHYIDKIGFKEHIHFDRTIEDSINEKYLDYAKKNNLPTTNTIKVRVDVTKNQAIFIVTSTGQTYSTNLYHGEIITDDTSVNVDTALSDNEIEYLFTGKGTKLNDTLSSIYNLKVSDDEINTLYKDIPVGTPNTNPDIKIDDLMTDEYPYLFGEGGGLVTYYYSYKKDPNLDTYGSFILNGDSVIDRSRFIIFENKDFSGYTLEDKDTGEVTRFSKFLDTDYNTEYVEFTLKYGEEFFAYLIADDNYNAGTLNMRYGRAENDDMHVYATDATPITQFIQVLVPEHAHIKAINGSNVYIDKSFEAMQGSYIEFETYADTGYTAGSLLIDEVSTNSLKGTKVVQDKTVVVSAEQPKTKKITVFINSPNNTTIRVIFDDEIVTVGANQSKTIVKDYNSRYSISLSTHSDYNAGTLNIKKSGILDSSVMDNPNHVTITATTPTLKYYTVYFPETENQTIIATYNFKDYTDEFIVPIHAEVDVRVVPNTGYTAGRPLKDTYIIDEDTLLLCSDAVPKTFNVTISAPAHQTIELSIEGNITTVKPNSSITLADVQYDSAYSIKLIADTGYQNGSLNIPSSGYVDDTISTDGIGTTIVITTTEATVATFAVSIVQTSNQSITVTYNGKEYTSDFIAVYGSKITAAVKPTAKFFDAGKLNITSATVTKDLTIEATNATIHKYNITITKYDKQRILVTEVFADETDNIIHTDSFKAIAQSHLRAEVEATDDNYNCGTINGNNEITSVESDIAFTATAATIRKYNIIIQQSENQTIHFKVNGEDHTSSFTCNGGLEYVITVVANTGYNAGTVYDVSTTGIVSDNMVIKASPASK